MAYVSQKARKGNKTAKRFLDPAALQAAILDCQANENQPSVTVCLMFRDIIDHLIVHKNWCKYPPDFKEDMASYAMERMIKGIRTFKLQPDNKKCNVFSYFVRTAEMAFLQLVLKRSKEIEKFEAYRNEALSQLRAEFPQLKSLADLEHESIWQDEDYYEQ